jgi:CubicO group peptidase (beta-lactamase class C family)
VTVHAAAYGLRNRESATPHDPSQTFRYASVSKIITAIVVLQEVDRGTLALDAPVATYLAGSGIPNAERITIRQLLAHRSGLAGQADLSTPGPDGRIADILEHCRASAAAPGTVFLYNNCDTIVLGEVLEAVTGLGFIDLVNQRLVPIGVTLSMPATPQVEAYMDATTIEDAALPTAFGPSGGLYGTAANLLAIDNALMAGQLMSDASLMEMLKGDPASGFAAFGVWSYQPDLGACLGQTRLVERYGEINGVQVRNFLLPDRNFAVVVYTNDRRVEFGQIWQGAGFSIDLLRAAACG